MRKQILQMPSELEIIGWTSQGLRCPDHMLDFQRREDECFSVSLIQMPNGTGKTTTLKLLRAALCGAPEDGQWTPETVRQLAKRDGAERGEFALRLRYNGRRVTIVLHFDFEEGIVHYSTTVGSGLRDGFEPPRELRRFFTPDFVRFFVFDGELAEQLLDRSYTNAQRAIEDLFQLDVLDRMTRAVDDYWDNQMSGRSATEATGLTRRRNRVTKLRKRLERLRKEREQLAGTLERSRSELLAKKQRLERDLKDQQEFGARVATAQAAANGAKEDVKRISAEVLAGYREPHALSVQFALEMLTLKENLDRVKLPESTAREFFEELAMENECVCGRPLDEGTRHSIRSRASKYLSSDSVALLNALKGEVGSAIGKNLETAAGRLQESVLRLEDGIKCEIDTANELDDVQRDGIARSPELESARDDVEALERRVNSLEDKLEQYDDPTDTAGDDQVFGIGVLERRYSDAERKLAEITHTLTLRAKRDVLKKILTRARELARSSISEEVCNQTNERIAVLMPDNSIRVQSIARSLVLEDQEGGSVGETLSIGYAFLATLFEGGDHRLPFVVDSPANPIDLRVRAKVAELIPRLTPQFIAFTISSEREGFLKPLESVVGDGIQYITLFRSGSSTLEDRLSSVDKVTRTKDGVLVQDADFFWGFHLDQEAASDAI